MRTNRPIAALILSLLLISTPAVAGKSQGLELHKNLPRDPLIK